MCDTADYDVAVVGGGPAGITAAIQACRSGLKVVLFEKDRLGGLLLNANLVENYPVGRPGIPGPELVEIFKEHLARFEVKIISDTIRAFSTGDGEFTLAGKEVNYSSKSLIIAAGTVPRKLDLPGLDAIDPGRVLYELKDLYPVPRGKRYAVIGGGDAVFDYSLNLSKYDSKITILVRSDSPGCLPLLKQRAEALPDSINVQYNTEVTSVEMDDASGDIHISTESEGVEDVLPVDILMIAVGRDPELSLIDDLIDEKTVYEGNPLHTKTNIPGLYLAGDMISGRNRQVGIAVGSGLNAAMTAAKYLATGGEK